MNRFVHDLARAALAATILIQAACGGQQSVASRSAAAYAEAQKKGEVAVTQEHADHSATASEPEMTGMDHSTMDHADHSTMTHGEHSAMAHANHAQMQPADHAQMQHADHARMQHGASAPPAGVPLDVPRSNAEIARVTPAATLQADAFDAPAATAVSEAGKAQGQTAHEHHQ